MPDESLNVLPERILESSQFVPDCDLLLVNILRNKGRSVGTHAATMTTFCSILKEEIVRSMSCEMSDEGTQGKCSQAPID